MTTKANLTNGTRRITFVPFVSDGRVALVRGPDGLLSLPAGDVAPGEDVLLDSALRIPLETAGFRRQHFHAFAQSDGHLLAWIEGDRYRGRRSHADADLVLLEPGDAAQALRDSGRADLSLVVEDGVRSFRSITDEEYLAERIDLLETAYLAADSAHGGSGKGGDERSWIAGRRHIADAIDRDGTFLDVGCANGYLMECMLYWTAERGIRIEPYGVDIGARLVEVARERLPQWADRIWQGDAARWVHPEGMRFDLVHTLLDCVRPPRRRDLVVHLLENVVAPGGRLIASHYIDPAASSEPGAAGILKDLGFDVAGETRPDPHSRTAPSAWIQSQR